MGVDLLHAGAAHVSTLDIRSHKSLNAGASHVYGNLICAEGGHHQRICVLRYVDEGDIRAAHAEHEKGWKIGDRTGRMPSVAALLRATLAQLREGRSAPCDCCVVRSERSGCVLAVCAVESWCGLLAARNKLSICLHAERLTGGSAATLVGKLRELDAQLLRVSIEGPWKAVRGGTGAHVEQLLKGET